MMADFQSHTLHLHHIYILSINAQSRISVGWFSQSLFTELFAIMRKHFIVLVKGELRHAVCFQYCFINGTLLLKLLQQATFLIICTSLQERRK